MSEQKPPFKASADMADATAAMKAMSAMTQAMGEAAANAGLSMQAFTEQVLEQLHQSGQVSQKALEEAQSPTEAMTKAVNDAADKVKKKEKPTPEAATGVAPSYQVQPNQYTIQLGTTKHWVTPHPMPIQYEPYHYGPYVMGFDKPTGFAKPGVLMHPGDSVQIVETVTSDGDSQKPLHKAADADTQDTEKLMAPPPSSVAAKFAALKAKAKKPAPIHELHEAVVYDASKHPRWPPGTVDYEGKNIGGEFMSAGQTFFKDGKRWEIQQIADGHVIAAEASGVVDDAATRVFDPKTVSFPADQVAKAAGAGEHPTIPGVQVAPSLKMKSGKGFHTKFNSVVFDARTGNGGAHDPSIHLPTLSDFSPEDWQRFGRADQLYYVELMNRFGAWPYGGKHLLTIPNHLKTKMDHEIHKVGAEQAVEKVLQAISNQKGDSTGNLLDLAHVFDEVSASSGIGLDKARKNYEKAREVEAQMNGVLAWDWYNRVRAPDITVTHRNKWSESDWKGIVAGTQGFMTGAPSTWTTNWKWGEPNVLSYALPIRNIVLTQDMAALGGLENEHEIANTNRMRFSPDMVSYWHEGNQKPTPGSPQAWLDGELKKTQPRSGQTIRDMVAHLHGKIELPLPEPESDFTVVHKASKPTHDMPSAAFMANVESALAKDPGKVTSGYAPVSSLDLKPGDVIATKNPETRYLVIKNSGAPLGLSYVQLLTGSSDYSNVFSFSSESANRYKVDKHFDLPTKAQPKPVAVTHDPAEWKLDGPKIKVGAMSVGDKLRINAQDWEITDIGTSKAMLKALTGDDTAHVNPLWKTQKLVQAAYKPTVGEYVVVHPHGLPPYAAKVTVAGEQGTTIVLPSGVPQTFVNQMVSKLPLAQVTPQKGDTFAWDGKKLTVTTVLKNGTVKAKASGGKVQQFLANDEALALLVRPDDYSIGETQKVGTMAPGALFSGSKQAVRPYMVIGGFPAKQVTVLNLDTGEHSILSAGKGYKLLIHKDSLEPQPTTVDTPHDQWQTGDNVNASALQVGDKFQKNGSNYTVLVAADSALTIKPDGGLPQVMSKSGAVVYQGAPEEVQIVGHVEQSQGQTYAKIEQVPVGSVFAPPTTGLMGSWWSSKKGPFTLTDQHASGVNVTDGSGASYGISYSSAVGTNGPFVVSEPAAPSGTDPAALPLLPFAPYKWHKGGTGQKHVKIAKLAEGSVFSDKYGVKFKVKQQGAVPIITDGMHLYTTDPNEGFVNYLPGAWIADVSPPVTGPEKQTYDKMAANTTNQSIEDLGLDEPGAQIWFNGKPWTLNANGHWAAPDGSITTMNSGVVPQKYVPVSDWTTTQGPASAKGLGLQSGDQIATSSGKKYTLIHVPQGLVTTPSDVLGIHDADGVVTHWGNPVVTKYKKQTNVIDGKDLQPGDAFQLNGYNYTLFDKTGKIVLPGGKTMQWGVGGEIPDLKVTKIAVPPIAGTIGALGMNAPFQHGGKTFHTTDGKIWNTEDGPQVVVATEKQHVTTLPANTVIAAETPKVAPSGHLPDASLTAYKWHKGGGGQVYTPIAKLQPGEQFTDKHATKFVYVKPTVQDGVKGAIVVGPNEQMEYTPERDEHNKHRYVNKLEGLTGIPNAAIPSAAEIKPGDTITSDPAAAALHQTPSQPQVGQTVKWKDLPIGAVVEAGGSYSGNGLIQKTMASSDDTTDPSGSHPANYGMVTQITTPGYVMGGSHKVGDKYYVGTENNVHKVVDLPHVASNVGVKLKDLPIGTKFNTPPSAWFKKKGEPNADQWQITSAMGNIVYAKPVGGKGTYSFHKASVIGETEVPGAPHTGSQYPNDPILAFFNNQDGEGTGTNPIKSTTSPNGSRVLVHGKTVDAVILKGNVNWVSVSESTSPVIQSMIKSNVPTEWGVMYEPQSKINQLAGVKPVGEVVFSTSPKVGEYTTIPDWMNPNDQHLTLGDLPSGSLYAIASPASSGGGFTVNKITGTKSAGGSPVAEGPNGMTYSASQGYEPSHVLLPPGASPDLVAEKAKQHPDKHVPVGSLRPGDLFGVHSINDPDWKDQETVWKVTGGDDDFVHHVAVQNYGKKITGQTPGKTQKDFPVFYHGHEPAPKVAGKPPPTLKGKATKWMNSMNIGGPAQKKIHELAPKIPANSWGGKYGLAMKKIVGSGHPAHSKAISMKIAIGPDPKTDEQESVKLSKALDDSLKQTGPSVSWELLKVGEYFAYKESTFMKSSPVDAKVISSPTGVFKQGKFMSDTNFANQKLTPVAFVAPGKAAEPHGPGWEAVQSGEPADSSGWALSNALAVVTAAVNGEKFPHGVLYKGVLIKRVDAKHVSLLDMGSDPVSFVSGGFKVTKAKAVTMLKVLQQGGHVDEHHTITPSAPADAVPIKDLPDGSKFLNGQKHLAGHPWAQANGNVMSSTAAEQVVTKTTLPNGHLQLEAGGMTDIKPPDHPAMGLLVVPSKINPSVIPDWSDQKLTETTGAGGTTGAMLAKDNGGSSWLIKKYGGGQDRVATELLANRVYHTLGIKVPNAGVYQPDPKLPPALAYPLMPGKTKSPWTASMKKNLANGYVADALLGNYDHIGLVQDNVIWNGTEPTRLDQGGTFFYRAQGKKKPFDPYPKELESMMTIGQAGENGLDDYLTPDDIRHQAADVAAKLPDEKINQLVDAAPFADQTMKNQIRHSLTERVAHLYFMGKGSEPLPPGLVSALGEVPEEA